MISSHRQRLRAFALAACVATCTVLGLAGSAGATPAASSAAAALPADPQQHGYIGLCNEAGQNVTGGSIDTRPFVWKAVSTTRPDKTYQGKGENAVLNIYQPRPGVDATQWSGNSLTAASFYSTPTHPTAQSTYADVSLREFIRQFPPQVNGLYALRFYYGKLNYGIYHATYPATVIQVSGSKWKVIRGGTVSCASGKAVSQEQLTGLATRAQYTAHKPADAQHVATSAPGHTISSKPASVRDAAGGSGSATGAGGTHVDATPASDTSSSSSSASDWALWLGLGIGVLGIGALAVAARSRRASSASGAPDQNHLE